LAGTRKEEHVSAEIMRPVAAALVTAALVLFAAPNRAAAHPSTADASVVTEWNAVAVRTIFTENATPVPSSGLYFGFVSLAVHDAIVTVEGRYEPYLRQPRPRGQASVEAAAATAAYLVLRHYFPASAANLATDYAASLAEVPDGPAKARGLLVGAVAAGNIVRARDDDGRNAPITLDVTPAPGVWRPTPDAFAPMLVPWLGFVEPLALRSPTQIQLPCPDPLDSRRYARDFAEVKAYGAKEGSARSPEQTETALFWNANSQLQYQVAMRDQVTRRGLDVAAAARAFALLGAATADAAISCWRAKYDHAYWRPITAIHLADTDGNPATEPDPAWNSLVPAPPYPDYTSGHACLTGAASQVYGHLFGRRSIDLDVSSSVTGTTRHYASVTALDQETMNARIWLGIHFRRAMTDGNMIGHRAAAWLIAHELRPTH
jgi:hypothetical protein